MEVPSEEVAVRGRPAEKAVEEVGNRGIDLKVIAHSR
jgi:hypothetical protein